MQKFSWIMKRIKNYVIFVLMGLLFTVMFHGCSDLEKPIPANQAPELEAHPDGWLDETSANFHGIFIRNSQWDLDNCKQCHGEDYTGGIAKTSCLTCHPATPEDCVVCHGGTDNQTGAPPEDIDGNIVETAPGVGAHTPHLEEDDFNAGIPCSSCHVVPAAFDAPGHTDSDLPAEITFSGLALADSANPNFNAAGPSCANVYCHGNWRLAKSQSNSSFIYAADFIEGNNSTPVWTDASSVACGTCHGLPPTGHLPFTLDQCTNCHTTVVDGTGTIIDKMKHINGNVNVFGQEYPMF